jgi:predicted transcriptional regulator
MNWHQQYRSANLMQAAKQDALHTINQLPDTADMEEIMYRLYVLDKIRKGQEAVEQGRTLTSEELQREIDSW